MLTRRKVAIGTAATLVTSYASVKAQSQLPLVTHSPTQSGQAVAEAILGFIQTGRGIPLLTATERLIAGPPSPSFDYAAQSFGFLGCELQALQAYDAAKGRQPQAAATISAARGSLAASRAIKALDALTGRAREHQIVMINEAHHVSRHRAFSTELALRLRDEGFGWFCAETFSPAITAFDGQTPVMRDMGGYVNDPVMANGLRALSRVGFRFAAYDYGSPAQGTLAQRQQARESRSAARIADLLKRESSARIIVHVGFEHLSKRDANVGGQTWHSVAQEITSLTGIEPFCIDQTWGSPRSRPELDWPSLTVVQEMFSPTEAVVIRSKSNLPFNDPAISADEIVFHPRLEDASGRPAWLAHQPSLRRVQFDTAEARRLGARLLHLFRQEDQPGKTVPTDSYVLRSAEPMVDLFAPAGGHIVYAETADDFVPMR